MVDFYGFYVGRDTSPIDSMGFRGIKHCWILLFEQLFTPKNLNSPNTPSVKESVFFCVAVDPPMKQEIPKQFYLSHEKNPQKLSMSHPGWLMTGSLFHGL